MNLFYYVAAIASYMGKNNETAPASDTASSGLNGRLQRIAQRVSTLITGITDTNNKLDTISTNIADSETLLNDVKTLLTRPNITVNNVIVAKTGGETSADVQLNKAAYAITAISLATSETVKIQVKDTVTNQYFDYLTLTASAPVATIQNLPVTVRFVKSATADSVGVNICYQ